MDPMPFGGMSVAEKINSFVNTKNGCGHEHQICFYIVTNKSFLLTICNFVWVSAEEEGERERWGLRNERK